ncbi:MAG: 30S ribosomal protein S13 [Firmicutes bacterium]|nr:30S ribosomal protein S13 [Bacillota bacterium]MCL2770802.1 30S ribosomal protein S13 [Bacillota bacterium]
MARIAGVDLPAEKRVLIGLTSIYGIGKPKSKEILEALKIDESIRCKNLTEEQVRNIKDYCDTHGILLEGDLKKKVGLDIKALTDVGNYRGIRHRKGLPVRGQRTHSNARSHKGPRSSGASTKNKKK